jgi:hypothetical protein
MLGVLAFMISTVFVQQAMAGKKTKSLSHKCH